MFPHPKIYEKEFAEDLDFFDDWNEEEEKYEYNEFNFVRDRDLALWKLANYSFKLNAKCPSVNI